MTAHAASSAMLPLFNELNRCLRSRAGIASVMSKTKAMKLPEYKGYTVDFRLKQFRFVHPGNCVCGGGEIEFIDFDSEKGDALLTEMSALKS